jgi:hypothetical protein
MRERKERKGNVCMKGKNVIMMEEGYRNKDISV